MRNLAEPRRTLVASEGQSSVYVIRSSILQKFTDNVDILLTTGLQGTHFAYHQFIIEYELREIPTISPRHFVRISTPDSSMILSAPSLG
jgi:hypothetical protein